MAYGTTYRLVYSFDTVTDKCSLWVNPTSEASTRIMTANPIAADTTISAVAFRQTNSTPPWAISIRNLIVSTTFAEACPPPPPPSPSQFRANLGALIGVNMNYITIRVSADSAPGSTIVQATVIVPDLPASQSVMSVLNGNPSDFTGALQAQFRANLASLLGVKVNGITIRVTAGSTILLVSIIVPSLDSAQASTSALQGNTAQLSASLGVTITSVSNVGTSSQVFDTVTDKCSLWVNPTSEASTRIMTVNPVAADTTISAVAFRQTNSTPPWAISIRNLIVSTTFAEACPPPPPPSPSFRANLGALIGVNMTDITIRVSADSAAGSTIVQATMIVPDLPASQSVMSVLN
ncbi:hypothetical protein Ctob_016556, partial [Chrysochromulina tobinii]